MKSENPLIESFAYTGYHKHIKSPGGKIMKKLLAVLLSATMFSVTALSGCTMNSPTEAKTDVASEEKTEGGQSGEKTGEKAKIGFLAPTLQTEFFISIDNGLKKECSDRGWDYVAVSFDNDSATAVTSIENMVTGKCDVIIAMVSDESCDDALRKAQEAGVKIIECGVQTEVFDVCLNTDQYVIGKQIGTMAGNWIKESMDGKGKVVIYTTFQNTDMQKRGNGIQDGLKEAAPDAEILEVVDIGKDVVGSGTTTTETMLQKYPDLNCIAAYGDAAAVESSEAAKAAGKSGDSFGIFSCDGTEQAIKGIAENDPMHGTIKFEEMGPIMAEYSERLLAGERFPEPIDFPTQQIDSSNVTEFYTAQ